MWQWNFDEVQGRRIHWGIRNPVMLNHPGHPLILFVHGAGSRADHWLPAAGLLPEDYCLLVLDRPGLGNSEGPPCLTVEETAQFIAAFLDDIGAKRSLIYVGHSMGGFVGLASILCRKINIAALILVASFSQYRVHAHFMSKLKEGCYEAEAVKPGFSSHAPAHVFDSFMLDMKQTNVVSVLRDFEMIDGRSLTGQLSSIHQPTLIVAGQEDWITPMRHAARLQQGIPGSRQVVIPKAGHYIQLEQPEAVAVQIEAFCESLNLTSI
jgi:pimeloyl-ACP methyl ester carboxylesterase